MINDEEDKNITKHYVTISDKTYFFNEPLYEWWINIPKVVR